MALAQALSMRRLFLVVIGLKIACALAGWLVGGLLGTWLLGFALPLGLMGAYVVVGLHWRNRDELSDEKFGDSCYYLGFIFTISSIVLSLIDLPSIGERLAEMAVRFGAAMVSTVLGLVVRVYIVNFRQDLFDIKTTIEEDLLDAEHAFRTHLELAVESLRQYASEVDDASRTALIQVRLGIEEVAASHAERFQALFQRIASEHRRISEENASHAKLVSDKLDEILSEHVTALVQSMNGFQKSVDDFARGLDGRLKRITFPDDFFARSLAQPVGRLLGTMDEIAGEVAELSATLRNGARRVGTALERVAQLADQITLSMEQVGASVGASRELLGLAREEMAVLAASRRSMVDANAPIGSSRRFVEAQHEPTGRPAIEVEPTARRSDAAGVQARGDARLPEQ